MIKVELNDRKYAYMSHLKSWVDQENNKIESEELSKELRTLAIQYGATEDDFKTTSSDEEAFIKANKKEKAIKPVKTKKKKIKLNSKTAISLSEFIKKGE